MTTKGGRAANGRSSIYQDSGGRWHAWVTVGTRADGRADRRHRMGATRAEVTAKAVELEKARDSASVVRPGRGPTVAEYLQEWLAGCRLSLKPNTVTGYENAVRLHITPAIGGMRLSAVRAKDVEKVYARMVAGDRLRSTPHVRRTMSAAFKQAVARGDMPRDPVALARSPRVQEFEVEPFTDDEARALLAAARAEPGGGAVWVLSLSLGMRKGEVLGLRWSDVDLNGGELSVRKSVTRHKWRHGCGDPDGCGVRPMKCPQREGGGLVEDTPKSRAGRREVSLPPQLVDVLRHHRRWQRELRLRSGSRWVDSGRVFTQETGRALDPRALHDSWKSLLIRAGVREGRLHDMRHTSATLLLTMGVDQRVVMAIHGWSQISMLHRYQHVVPALRKDAAARMGEVLFR